MRGATLLQTPGGWLTKRCLRNVRRRNAVLVSAKYDYAARDQYITEVKRLIDQAEFTSRTEQDGLTKLLIGVSLPLLKFIASTPPPKEPQARTPPPPSYDNSGSDWRASQSSSYGYNEEPPRASFGGSVASAFRREPAEVSFNQQQAAAGPGNPQVSALVKLARAGFVGFAVSLFFGTIPFLDLLQLPDKGGALGWAVYSAAYLWLTLALLRFGKLSTQQPFQVLPDGTERSAEAGALGNTPSVALFSLLNATADGLLYRGALLTAVAAAGDILVSADPSNQSLTSPTTIILVTAAVETVARVVTPGGASSSSAAYGSYGSPGASATDAAVNAATQFSLVAFLASETLSTGSLLGSIGTQALGFYLITIAARQGWMQVPDGRAY